MATTNKKVVTKLLQAKRKNKKMNKKVTKPFQSNEMAKMNKKVTQSFQCNHWPLILHCQTSHRFEWPKGSQAHEYNIQLKEL